MSEHVTARHRELALQAMRIMALSEPQELVENIALLFALAHSEGATEVLKRLRTE